ncbi:Sec-independent protein translocase subunit TatA [Actinokineospora sp. NBRC 105648]|uniref:Sec-independent protein translocase subunit TatA n=1 Tax=Actinokineospora sp. NBRC 105648 TaxID=3032206 RepID=UPI0024A60880|nr:Sec-independent protein translocase subunit TatA [Actinokineospora sp. NBRC 105648]GLZ37295.1 sec-independent protein translocase protein TatA [Actinokineospora sp. NBRC 105648]
MNLGPWEILIIAVVVVLLFGARKMPTMARSLGQSMRILKAETKGMRGDDAADETKGAPAASPAPSATPAQQLPAAKVEQTPEQMRAEIDELQRKLNQQGQQAHKNAS